MFATCGQAAAAGLGSDENGTTSTSENNPNNKDLVGQKVGVAVTGANGSTYPQGTTTVTKAP